MSEPGLFDEVLARGGVRAAVSDPSWLRALLEVEAALARAQAKVGLLSAEDAATVAAACRPDRIDAGELAGRAAESGNPVVALVASLREVAGGSVHMGATSQDVLDTAAMLVARRALDVLLDDLAGAADAAAGLAREHRDTAMAGRTLLQQAVPITFGLKAARWLVALDEAADRLGRVRSRLAVQLGGPAGTLGAFDVVEAFAAELELAVPTLPWHTDRTRIADLAGALGTAAGTIGKIARDVTLLSQPEVGEVAEAAPGGSSSMAHKRNPVAAVSALACASQAPGLVATLLAAMVQEHERAAGAWQAEWRPLRELLTAVGSAAAWLRQCLSGLVVDSDALARNLARLVSHVDAGVGASAELVDRALAAREER
ncbi:MAG TPA: 3-carboxy-cis,cis-muconate cycloisomerase [Actinophytocola sp.]|uniref:3-carboxy-cis,cis-muconate cycloisomerase n=1 Tax=Actinophytocola sp. TaxID=1872138 RepID=UPI002DDD93CE|nr:3-carboxy-cis,cis-muconate cycloisomerase [Actinophytocola sp.]HEV2783436.1 3-carboxy-cis,cis-muconate cycloisomerase [Actinophytocola sp.]